MKRYTNKCKYMCINKIGADKLNKEEENKMIFFCMKERKRQKY